MSWLLVQTSTKENMVNVRTEIWVLKGYWTKHEWLVFTNLINDNDKKYIWQWRCLPIDTSV